MRPGPYAGSYVLSFYNRPNSLLSRPVCLVPNPMFRPQEKKSARCRPSISATMKLHSMTRVPRVTVSRALPRHSSARPSTEHSRPQYLVSLSPARPHFLHVRAAKMNTPDPVSTRKRPFPTVTDSSVAAPSWGPASIA